MNRPRWHSAVGLRAALLAGRDEIARGEAVSVRELVPKPKSAAAALGYRYELKFQRWMARAPARERYEAVWGFVLSCVWTVDHHQERAAIQRYPEMAEDSVAFRDWKAKRAALIQPVSRRSAAGGSSCS